MTYKKTISIITATFNSEKTINNLINSFRESKHNYIEWIIIDNNSNDNTLKLLQENSDLIDTLISENDNGIYDAWNKGINASKGDYIAFIGSDDTFNHSYFETAYKAINEHPFNNIIAFKILYTTPTENLILNTAEYKFPYNYPFNLGFYHPGTLHKKNLFSNSYFDINYKIAGDREFLTRISKDLKPIIYLSNNFQIIHSFGGISTKIENKLRQQKEIINIFKKYNVNNLVLIYSILMTYFKYYYYKTFKYLNN